MSDPKKAPPVKPEASAVDSVTPETDAMVAAQISAPAPKKKRGQPTRCTPAVTKIICDTIRKGNYKTVAARAAGISTDALNDWERRGTEGREPYKRFLAELEQADRDCEIALVSKVMAAADDDWRAAAMILERKYPDRWSRARDEDAGNIAVGLSIHIHVGESEGRNPAVEKFHVEAIEVEVKKIEGEV